MIKPSCNNNREIIYSVIEKIKWLESLTYEERKDYFNKLYSFQEVPFSDSFLFFNSKSSKNVLDGQYESITRFYVSLSLGTLNLNKTAEQFPAIKINLKTKKVNFTVTSSIATKTNNYLIIPLELSEIKKEDIIESVNLLLLFKKDLRSIDFDHDWIDELIEENSSNKELNKKIYDVLIGSQFEKSILEINQINKSKQNRSNLLKSLFETTRFKESITFKFYPSDVYFYLNDTSLYDLVSFNPVIFELLDFFSARARLINYLNNNSNKLTFKNKIILRIESLKIKMKGSCYLINKAL